MSSPTTIQNDTTDMNHGYVFWKEKLNGARLILAPMVDQSELAWRLLSKKYGAQLTYTPMMHAAVFVRDATYRQDNFVSCPEDRPLIAQFCTDDPDLFVKAGKYIENDCDAIDLNLGCPQNIARRGHYGSFLQEEWDLVYEIISKGVTNLKVPITAKIRVFEDVNRTVEYAKMLEKAGVSILTVHGRTREQKGPNTGLASWDHIKAVKDNLKIPIFANGNILCLNDALECMKYTGCDGVMSAEPNLHNPALFAQLNPNAWDISAEYLQLIEKYPCPLAWIRGHIFKIFQKIFERHTHFRERMGKAKNIQELKDLIEEAKQLCLKDVETSDKNSKEIFYWMCQPYLRPLEEEKKNSEEIKLQLEETLALNGIGSNSKALKRQLDEINKGLNERPDQLDPTETETALKIVKLLDRKRRKQERVERKQSYQVKFQHSDGATIQNKIDNYKLIKKDKYVNCANCKNPSSIHCDHQLCRSCCKEAVFTKEIKCTGHKFSFKHPSIPNSTPTEISDEIKTPLT